MSNTHLEQGDSSAQTFKVESLTVRVHRDTDALAEAMSGDVQVYLREILEKKGKASVMLATGNSQIEFLKRLVERGGIDWSRISLFHMDEYLGIDSSHPSSFRRYLRERVEEMLHPRVFHYLEGDSSLPLSECDRYSRLLQENPIDLCCLGVGENGHLAFNDPPVADFNDPYRVKLVKLDRACKQQQVSEGHFPDLDSVPPYAMTVTIPGLCAAGKMICIAPEARKAEAVRDALQGPVSTACPASILRHQAHASLELDPASARLLSKP